MMEFMRSCDTKRFKYYDGRYELFFLSPVRRAGCVARVPDWSNVKTVFIFQIVGQPMTLYTATTQVYYAQTAQGDKNEQTRNN